MATYRTTRNIEASIIEHLQDSLESTWTDVHVEKSFAKIYKMELPSICVKAEKTNYDPAEVGSNKKIRSTQVIIDIFATDDGLRLDLKDTLIEVLQDGCIYNKYVTSKQDRTTNISSTTADGRIRVMNIEDTPVNFDTDREKLDIHDRFRHRLILTIELGRIE
jgi:hypothetical protein